MTRPEETETAPTAQAPSAETREDAAPRSGGGPPAEELIQRLIAAAVPLWHDARALLAAQWDLSLFRIREQGRLALVRAIIWLHIYLLVGAAWVFLNIAVWRLTASLLPTEFAPPMALLLLNLLAAGTLHAALARYRL